MRAGCEALLAHARVTAALASVAQRTGWDQETMMPAGSGDQRADELAALLVAAHVVEVQCEGDRADRRQYRGAEAVGSDSFRDFDRRVLS